MSYLYMKFIFPPLPEPLLGTNYHVKVMESVGIIELYLDPGRFVFLQLLDLKMYSPHSLFTVPGRRTLTSFTSNLSRIETRLLLSSFFVLVGFPSDSCLSLLVNVIILRLF